MLPASVFRTTAEIQARRRLGLTATLVREDGREDDVFALIGPKRYDASWKLLEAEGYIAEAICCEIRLELPTSLRVQYALAPKREKFRLAAENPEKIDIVEELIATNRDDQILVIGVGVGRDQRQACRRLGGVDLEGLRTPQRSRQHEEDQQQEHDVHQRHDILPRAPPRSPGQLHA